MNRFDCVIPAAGLSRRMGEWKPGLLWRGRRLVEWSVFNALAACRRVILVSGFNWQKLEGLFPNPGGRLVITRNRDYQRGMTSSIKAGIELVETEKFFVAPADMPSLGPELFLALERALDGRPSPAAARPLYRGRPGHPVLFERTAIAAIASLPDGDSLRAAFDACGPVLVETGDPGSVFDVDEPADLDYSGC